MKHLCEGSDYAKLGNVSHLTILKALCGPQIAAEMLNHDSVDSVKVWSDLKTACEGGLVIYASTGAERSLADD